jgi:Protein of unknown function (DUF2809)
VFSVRRLRFRARGRLRTGLALICILLLGLASRQFPLFPSLLGKYPGDALWTALVYAGWALVFPAASVRRLLLLALVTSLAVELSQLCQAPWLRQIRRTAAGHLVLGSTYSSADLLAYAAGGAAAALADTLRVLARRPAGLQRDEPGGD